MLCLSVDVPALFYFYELIQRFRTLETGEEWQEERETASCSRIVECGKMKKGELRRCCNIMGVFHQREKYIKNYKLYMISKGKENCICFRQ
jgi:hypothetical protein